MRKLSRRRWLLWTLIVLVAVPLLWLGWALLVYGPTYLYRVLAWRESDAFDWQKFPNHPLAASPNPHAFPEAPDPRAAELLAQLAGADDWGAFLAQNQTQAFIVVHDGRLVYEQYFNGTQRDTLVTSFSVAKSITSALVGMAIDEGFIGSVDDPVTYYLPELARRDRRWAAITLRHLLRMASGLDYQEFRPLLFNSDDPLTTYYPDQRRAALEFTRLVRPPGQVFSYNKYHPQLLGMVLERTTGMSVTAYLQTRLWDPLGMAYAGSWSTDSTGSDFERMEAGLNARALDFARFGALFVEGGQWQGQPVLSAGWVRASTEPYFPDLPDYYPESFAARPGRAYYQFMWWGFAREDGAYDFVAAGDKGQYIYVAPQQRLVIVRNGIDYGLPFQPWLELFYNFASQY